MACFLSLPPLSGTIPFIMLSKAFFRTFINASLSIMSAFCIAFANWFLAFRYESTNICSFSWLYVSLGSMLRSSFSNWIWPQNCCPNSKYTLCFWKICSLDWDICSLISVCFTLIFVNRSSFLRSSLNLTLICLIVSFSL